MPPLAKLKASFSAQMAPERPNKHFHRADQRALNRLQILTIQWLRFIFKPPYAQIFDKKNSVQTRKCIHFRTENSSFFFL